MCGRYASTRSAADLAALFEALDETEGELVADYNVAPTDPVPIVRHSTRTPRRIVSVGRWGFVPSWARDASGAARMINARAETVATSRAFATAFRDRRCLVPADGWYEWMREQGRKQPYFLTRPDGLAFGGIWTAWSSANGGAAADWPGVNPDSGRPAPVRSLRFSILTVPAEGDLARIHERMPLIVEPSRWADWLGTVEPAALLVAPAPGYTAEIELRPVSTAVGDVRNDGPELVRRSAGPMAGHSIMDSLPPTLF